MNDLSFVCSAVEDNDTIQLLSPSIGRIELVVSIDDIIHPQQRIGFLWRLGRRFALLVDDKSQGVVSAIYDRHRYIPVHYQTPFIALARSQANETKKEVKAHTEQTGRFITAPMDGLFYLSPAPDQPAFVKVGDTIYPGQTIGLIEVMKSFYPVKYEGKEPSRLTSLVVTKTTPVQVGSKLMAIA